jgi:general secretion pathway protein C
MRKAVLDATLAVAKLAFILSTALLVAQTLSPLASMALRPPPAPPVASAPGAVPPAAGLHFDIARLYALIGVSRSGPGTPEPGADAKAGAPPNCGDAAAPPAPSALAARLVGAVISESPERSLASITDLPLGETWVHGMGSEVQGARLLSVETIRTAPDVISIAAIVCNGGRKEYLALATPRELVVSALARTASPGVRRVDDQRFDIDRAFAADALGNLSRHAGQAVIVPAFSGSAMSGFKLFAIQPGSIFAALGIENGDVVQRVNGYEVDSPDKLLELYQRLGSATQVTVELSRAGRVIRHDYRIN